MTIFTEYIRITFCGTPHQREVGRAGLAAIFSGGQLAEAKGFWLDTPLEDNTVITCWASSIDDHASDIIRLLRAYQRYARQEEIFFEVKTRDQHVAASIAPEGWSSEGLEVLDRGSWLANYFSGGGG
jgi:hypothetical protein